MSLPQVYCLMGPTAAGKTDKAIQMAQEQNCDLISVDSALVYRGMNIGTAKPDAQTLKAAPHALIDIIEPYQSYSAADFCRDAVQAIEQSLAKGRTPLLVGGTMMYFRALQQGLSPLPQACPKTRALLEMQLAEQGLAHLYKELQSIDPLAASKIKPNDKQRIQRALEVFRLSNIPLSTLQLQQAEPLPYEFVNYAIIPDDRAELHARIAERFHLMLTAGFIDEVCGLRARGDLNLNLPSMRAVGYRQVWQYLDGEFDKATMIDKGIAATRQLAKRQLTWLRRWPKLVHLSR
jgi:tRNA dimethylallyltransferase